MTVIVTDLGFSTEDAQHMFTTLDALPANVQSRAALDLAPDADLSLLEGRLGEFAIIRIDFPNFSDGRGMTLARRLRLMGYPGTLRARGHVIADQYAMARRSGFDEIEIADDLAARQGEDQWLFRAIWRQNDYQNRLRG